MKSCLVENITFVNIFEVHNFVYNNCILLLLGGGVRGGSVGGSSTKQVREEKNCALLFNFLQLRLFEILKAYIPNLGRPIASQKDSRTIRLKSRVCKNFMIFFLIYSEVLNLYVFRMFH